MALFNWLLLFRIIFFKKKDFCKLLCICTEFDKIVSPKLRQKVKKLTEAIQSQVSGHYNFQPQLISNQLRFQGILKFTLTSVEIMKLMVISHITYTLKFRRFYQSPSPKSDLFEHLHVCKKHLNTPFYTQHTAFFCDSHITSAVTCEHVTFNIGF